MAGLSKGLLGDNGNDANNVNNADNVTQHKTRRGRHTRQAVEAMQAAEANQSAVNTSRTEPTMQHVTPVIHTSNAGVQWEIGNTASKAANRVASKSVGSAGSITTDSAADGALDGMVAVGNAAVRHNSGNKEHSEGTFAQVRRDTPRATSTTIPTILFVCHGNICRSVSGEYLLRHAAAQYGKLVSNGQMQVQQQSSQVQSDLAQSSQTQSSQTQLDCIIRSCGLLRHMHGSPAEPTIVQLLQQRGVDASDSRSQFVQAKDLQEATVVLCFSRRQAGELVDIEPRAARKIFIIDEFAALCQAAVEHGYVQTSDSQGMAVALESTGHVQTLDMSADCAQRLQAILTAAPLLRPMIAQPKGVEDPFVKEYDVFVQAVNQIEQYVQTIATALFA